MFTDTLAIDLRQALRTLRRSPAFSVVVILTLALGIGANTAMFSLLDQVVLRRLPLANAAAFVQLDGPGPFSGSSENDRAFSFPMYRDLAATPQVLTAVIARSPAAVSFRAGGASERVTAELVSGNTFTALGIRAALGRVFTPDDDVTPGAHPVVVLGHNFWQRRLAGDPAVIGRTVVVNATAMTVVGVAPPRFSGVLTNEQPAFFAPLAMKAALHPTALPMTDRRYRWLQVIAILAPGVTSAQAKAALDVRYRQANAGELVSEPRFAASSALFKERFAAKTLVLHDASRGLSTLRDGLGTPVVVLMAMVGVVLLIACANVANLMLARATGRRREMSVRLALGAGRLRLVRQTLVESVVVALAGGALGLVLAVWLGDALLVLLPLDDAADVIATTPDTRVALFTLAMTGLTAVLFGLAPALRGSAVDVSLALKEEATAAGGGPRHARLRRGLVVAQVALSTLLVAGAGLFVRSLANIEALGPGFSTERLVSFSLDPSLSGRSQAETARLLTGLESDLGRQPGVLAVALADQPLLTGNAAQRTIRVAGYDAQQNENLNPWTLEVGADFFTTLGVPVLAGRAFTSRDVDGAPRVAIVNETFARYFFGDENPIGRRFGFSADDDPARLEIVGVVRDSAYTRVRPGEASEVERLRVPVSGTPRVVYTPYAQSDRLAEVTFYLRTAGDVVDLGTTIRNSVRRADPTLPIYRLTSMTATVAQSLFVERMLALLSLLFGGLATLLAALGLYGVVSYTVARRTRELGIRIALGASAPEVVRLVMSDVAWLTGLGVLLGLPGAYALGRAATAQLFGLSALDPVSLGGAAAVLATVGLLAGYLPARRAAGTAPVLALRAE